MPRSSKKSAIKFVSDVVGLTPIQADQAYTAFFQYIKQSLKKNETVYFPDFGSFSVAKRSARSCRLPNGTIIKVKAKKYPKFNPYKHLTDTVN
jgi:DNA-binding protein HU-beta